MFRISNRMMYNNTLINAFRNNQALLKAQEELSSGKRINRPSDDPVGMMEVLSFRTDIGKSDQYLKVMDNASSFLDTADSVIGSVHDSLKRAKETALQQAGGLASPETRQLAAHEIDSMIEQMIQYGNHKVGNRYLFSGQRSEAPALDSNGAYTGSGKDLRAEIVEGLTIPISVKASDFLSGDMNPAVSSANNGTLLSSLNGGSGVPAGDFTIVDRSGASATITVTAGMAAGGDVEDVISAINAAGINVSASVSSDGTGLVLTDSTATPVRALSIVDGGNGTAQALGIAGSRNTSVFTGDDIDPDISGSTLVSDLYAGDGMTLDDIVIVNGGASATVSFAGATTVQDVINNINAAGAAINVSVALDSSGRKLSITSTNPNTIAFAKEAGTGDTAELLGIGGGRNAIPILKIFSAALKANDTGAILGAIDLLDSSMSNASSVRGAVGSRARQVETTRESVDQSKYDNTRLKSLVEDADFLKSASELAMLQTAYQSTLKSSASIIQPSLMDFIG